MERAVAKDAGFGYVQHGVLEILEVADRFADTGKSKAALKEAFKKLERLGSATWPIPTGYALVASLVSKEPAVTLDVCARCRQHFRPRFYLAESVKATT